MQMARWIIKATDTHSEYLIAIFVPLQQRLNESISIIYIYSICLVHFVLLERQKGKVVFSFAAQYFENLSV
jgi:hypothetical protein